MALKDWLPQDPLSGPPLPQWMEISWPWQTAQTVVNGGSMSKFENIGYVTWQVVSRVQAKMWDMCTTVVVPAVNPLSNGSIVGMYDGDLSELKTLADQIHIRNPSCKAAPYLYTDQSGNHGTTLSVLVSSASLLQTFVNNVKNLLQTYDLDGLVIDPEDESSTTVIKTVCAALYAVLNPLGYFVDVTGRPYGSPNVSLETAQYIRYIHDMSYDQWQWPDIDSGYPHSSLEDHKKSSGMWSDAGWDKKQIVDGMPFYGRTKYDSKNYPEGYYQESLNYYQILAQNSNAYNLDSATLKSSGGYNRPFFWGSAATNREKTRWSIDNGSAGVFEFSLGYDDSSLSMLTAIYDEIKNTPTTTHELTIAVSGSGTTTPSPGTYTYDDGAQVNLTATPASGWQFSKWSSGETTPTITITMTADTSITAIFTQVTPTNYYLNVSVSPSGAGTVTVTPPGTKVTSSQTVPYSALATKVNISQSPASGYNFSYWLLDGVKMAVLSQISSVNRSIQAVYTPTSVTHKLTIGVSGSGTTSPAAGTYDYADGTQVTVSATPASGWQFSKWSSGATTPTVTITMTADTSITAIFTQVTPTNYYLNVSVSPAGAGTVTVTPPGTQVSTSGTINYSALATRVNLSQSPASGYNFSYWLLDGVKKTVLYQISSVNRSIQAVYVYRN